MMTWKWPYAVATAALFVTELLIALFVHDGFVRPLVGDSLAVILVYVALRTVLPWRVVPALAAALAFAFAIEISQAFHLIQVLHLSHSRIAHFVLGSGFDLRDFVAYTAGGIAVLAVETFRRAQWL